MRIVIFLLMPLCLLAQSKKDIHHNEVKEITEVFVEYENGKKVATMPITKSQ